VVGRQPGRDNFVARLPGNGGGRPVLLLAHTDVVSVERDQWERDPFGGELVDGFVWGRGAVDTRNQVAANLMVLLLLKREGLTLTRDVIMAAPADEEAGSVWGAQWLWENRRDLIDAEYGLKRGAGNSSKPATAASMPLLYGADRREGGRADAPDRPRRAGSRLRPAR